MCFARTFTAQKATKCNQLGTFWREVATPVEVKLMQFLHSLSTATDKKEMYFVFCLLCDYEEATTTYVKPI